MATGKTNAMPQFDGSSGLVFQEVPDFETMSMAVDENDNVHGLVQILNDNIKGGGFFLPYDYSLTLDSQHDGMSIDFEDGSRIMVNVAFGAAIAMITITDMEDDISYVEIYWGISNFETGWSARYFVLNT